MFFKEFGFAFTIPFIFIFLEIMKALLVVNIYQQLVFKFLVNINLQEMVNWLEIYLLNTVSVPHNACGPHSAGFPVMR